MQNSIMRYRRTLAAVAAIFLLVSVMQACSLARLGYRNGETISYYWLNSYVDFDRDQQFWVRKEIDALFAWHHRTQLPAYVRLLTAAQKRVHGSVTESELQADVEDIRKRGLAIFEHALPTLADLALGLRPEQIAQIEKKFASNNKDFRKEFMRGDVAHQQQVRYKQVMKYAEYWFGNFSSDQERRIRAASDARPLDNELMLAARQERQAAMLAMLKTIQAEQPPRPAVEAMLREFLSTVLEHRGKPEQREFFEATRAANLRLAALIINGTTAGQKQHFVHTTQQWIDEFEALGR